MATNRYTGYRLYTPNGYYRASTVEAARRKAAPLRGQYPDGTLLLIAHWSEPAYREGPAADRGCTRLQAGRNRTRPAWLAYSSDRLAADYVAEHPGAAQEVR